MTATHPRLSASGIVGVLGYCDSQPSKLLVITAWVGCGSLSDRLQGATVGKEAERTVTDKQKWTWLLDTAKVSGKRAVAAAAVGFLALLEA